MREIIVLGEALTARLGDHGCQLAPQTAGADPADLLFEVDPAMPDLQRRQPGQDSHVQPIGSDGCSRQGTCLPFRGARAEFCDSHAGRQALHVDGEIDTGQRLVEIVDVE
jgi:hypothetical protein